MIFEFGSDLHLDFNVSDVTKLPPKSDTLVLAGDVIELNRLFDSSDRRAYEARAWFEQINANYKNVIWVMGNHEHYHYNIDDSFGDARRWLEQKNLKNIHILENQTLEIEDVIFFGATLWTDLNKKNPLSMARCASGMNDYHQIRKNNTDPTGRYPSRKFTPQDSWELHVQTLAELMKFVDLETDKKKVLVTHHLPFLQCIRPQWRNKPMNEAYASDLFDLLVDSDVLLSIHGHSHVVYSEEIAGMVVTANPRGYSGYEATASNFAFRSAEL